MNYRKDVIFISIRQAKNNECTKDGRSWYVDLTYRDLLGKRCRYHSKKFATRREAKDHEAEFKVKNNNLNIKKNITGYSSKDVEKLINYSTNLERLNNINKNKLDSNENTINRLSMENNFYKNNKELIDSKKYIYKQNIELKNKDDEIDYWRNAFKKVSSALDIKLNRKPMRYVSDYISLADSIKAANKLNKEAEEAADEFHKLFEL